MSKKHQKFVNMKEPQKFHFFFFNVAIQAMTSTVLS